MSKGDKRRGNREAKKPKKVKEKPVATANSSNIVDSVKAGQMKNKNR
ncbi:MAG: hypothetical protein AAFW46_11965 [Pseudomonadota bacterium]